jgi:hypothetical protein
VEDADVSEETSGEIFDWQNSEKSQFPEGTLQRFVR